MQFQLVDPFDVVLGFSKILNVGANLHEHMELCHEYSAIAVESVAHPVCSHTIVNSTLHHGNKYI